MDKKERAAVITERLKKQYPVAQCTLSYEDAWQLMVAVRLAAQCTDARVDMVTPVLFERFPTAKSLAEAPYEEIVDIVKPCGLGNTKARDIKNSMIKLTEQYGGIVPDDMDELLSFPGVGRKSANLILGDIYGKPAVVCDTHCIRICGLLGLTDSRDPLIVEKQLKELLDPAESNDYCHRMVLHGRACCIARRPKCEECCVKDLCDYFVRNSKKEN